MEQPIDQQVPVMDPSVCGTLWENANSRSLVKAKDTPNGFLVFVSLLVNRYLSLFLVDGTNWSRFGTWPTANSEMTWLDTLDI